MYETLQRTGRFDPADLLEQPEEVVLLHLAHTRSLFIGRYEPPAPSEQTDKPEPKRTHPPDLERWRRRDRSRDVAQARLLLAQAGLPEHVRQAAQATLNHAGDPS